MSYLQHKIPMDLFDRIQDYYLHGSELNETDKEICERWEAAFALLCESKTKREAIIKHHKTANVAESMAYIDMRNAELIFAPLKKYTKEFLRLITIESARQDIARCEEMYKKLPKKADVYKWRVVMQEKDRAEQRLIKAAGLDRSDSEMPDMSKLKPNTYNVVLPKQQTRMLDGLLEKGDLDITKLYESLSGDNISDAHIIDD